MKTYIATFGSGQENAGFYIEIHCNNYHEAVNYMENNYYRNYCCVYSKEYWDSILQEAEEKGWILEKRLCVVNLK